MRLYRDSSSVFTPSGTSFREVISFFYCLPLNRFLHLNVKNYEKSRNRKTLAKIPTILTNISGVTDRAARIDFVQLILQECVSKTKGYAIISKHVYESKSHKIRAKSDTIRQIGDSFFLALLLKKNYQKLIFYNDEVLRGSQKCGHWRNYKSLEIVDRISWNVLIVSWVWRAVLVVVVNNRCEGSPVQKRSLTDVCVKVKMFVKGEIVKRFKDTILSSICTKWNVFWKVKLFFSKRGSVF